MWKETKRQPSLRALREDGEVEIEIEGASDHYREQASILINNLLASQPPATPAYQEIDIVNSLPKDLVQERKISDELTLFGEIEVGFMSGEFRGSEAHSYAKHALYNWLVLEESAERTPELGEATTEFSQMILDTYLAGITPEEVALQRMTNSDPIRKRELWELILESQVPILQSFSDSLPDDPDSLSREVLKFLLVFPAGESGLNLKSYLHYTLELASKEKQKEKLTKSYEEMMHGESEDAQALRSLNHAMHFNDTEEAYISRNMQFSGEYYKNELDHFAQSVAKIQQTISTHTQEIAEATQVIEREKKKKNEEKGSLLTRARNKIGL